MTSPSSLVFLVLVGVWAVYFFQYWVRRRDHIATARSVEQFSAAMRVLERRDQQPETGLAATLPRSRAVHPPRVTPETAALPPASVERSPAVDAPAARPDDARRAPAAVAVRPDLSVARSDDAPRAPAAAAVRPDPSVARSDDARTGSTPPRLPSTAGRTAGTRGAAPAVVHTSEHAHASTARAARGTAPGPRPGRRPRAMTFVATTVSTFVTAVLAAFSVVPGWW
ncbi:MAG: hypothetical protein ACRCYR_07705, partial [Phycicoccus sp.]